MPSITVRGEASTSGFLGDIGPQFAETETYNIETGLDGDTAFATVDLTTTAAAIPTGVVDVTKAHLLVVNNVSGSGATNYIIGEMYDGTNSIACLRLYGIGGRAVVPMPPQVSGYPKLRLKMSTGTGKASVKVLEQGVPELAA
jgi:hypothetical protein